MTIKQKMDLYYNPKSKQERELKEDRQRLRDNKQPEILAWINPMLRMTPVNNGGDAA